MRNPFHVLRLSAHASMADAKAAHRFWTFALHPDRFAGQPEFATTAGEILKRVNVAHAAIAEGTAPRPSAPVPVHEVLWVSAEAAPERVDRAMSFWRFALAADRFNGGMAARAAEELRRAEGAFERMRTRGSPAPQRTQTPPLRDRPRVDAEVVYVQGKRRYHRAGCTRIRQHCRELWLHEAIAEGMRPCRTCRPAGSRW